MYWCAVTSPGEDEGAAKLKVAKWKSVANHIMDVHDGHGSEFSTCAHGTLTGEDRKKEWIKPRMYASMTHW